MQSALFWEHEHSIIHLLKLGYVKQVVFAYLSSKKLFHVDHALKAPIYRGFLVSIDRDDNRIDPSLLLGVQVNR